MGYKTMLNSCMNDCSLYGILLLYKLIAEFMSKPSDVIPDLFTSSLHPFFCISVRGFIVKFTEVSHAAAQPKKYYILTFGTVFLKHSRFFTLIQYFSCAETPASIHLYSRLSIRVLHVQHQSALEVCPTCVVDVLGGVTVCVWVYVCV